MKRLICVLGLGLALVACTAKPQSPQAAAKTSPTPTTSPSPTLSSTPSLSLSVIYGVGPYAQHGYYRTTIEGGRTVSVPAAWFGPFTISGSPDGRFLARYKYLQDPSFDLDVADLEIASSDAPGTFHRITRAHNSTIADVFWSRDSSILFYSLSTQRGDSGASVRIYQIGRDGTGNRLVANLGTSLNYYRLVGADAAGGKLYVIDEGAEFEVIDIATGHSSDVPDGHSIASHRFAFAADMTKVYYATDSAIIEQQLADGARRIVYRIHHSRQVVDIQPSPNGDAITFDLAVKQADGSTPPSVISAYLLELESGRWTARRYKSFTGRSPQWSPGGTHLWFECACGPRGAARAIVMNHETRQTTVIGDGHDDESDFERVITWIVA